MNKRKSKMKHPKHVEHQVSRGILQWGYLTSKLVTFVASLLTFASLTVIGAAEKTVTIPAGTSLLVKLDKAVSSSDKPGTKFSGVLQGDLMGDGIAAVKTGSAVIGEVT